MTTSSTSLVPVRKLLSRLVAAADRDEFLDHALDVLVELTGADRGLVFLADDSGASCVINARAAGRALAAADREEVSRTIVRECQRSGGTVRWQPAVRGPAPTSFQSLGILDALAVPLPAVALTPGARGVRGVLYIDFRDPRRSPGPAEVELAEATAELCAIVLNLSQRLEHARAGLRHALAAADGAPAPSLAELLAPPSMAAARAELAITAGSDLSVLMLGESGTGKTLLARAIAEASARRPTVRATLGNADNLNTITSELFGHERGSFSGALSRRVGLVEYADGGTLILDEVLNLPPHAQQLLLDFTQFGTFRPLGWAHAEPKRARVRIIAATNGDLPAAIAAGRFREDLYHRLAAVSVTLPSLRERRDEVPGLAEGLLRRIDPDRAWAITLDGRRALTATNRPWAGNLRELETTVQRARLRALAADPAATTITAAHLDVRAVTVRAVRDADPAAGFRALAARRALLDDDERAILQAALARHGGVVAHAAAELGLRRTSLVSRLQALKLKP